MTHGCLSEEFEIKSPAKKLIDYFIKNMVTKDEKAPVVTEEIKGETTLYRIEGIEILEWYDKLIEENISTEDVAMLQNLEGSMVTTHVEGEDSDLAKLTIRYEKISSDIEDPNLIMEDFVALVKKMDEYLLKATN